MWDVGAVHASVRASAHASVRVSARASVCLSVRLSVRLSMWDVGAVRVSVRASVCASVRSPVRVRGARCRQGALLTLKGLCGMLTPAQASMAVCFTALLGL